MMFAYPFPSTFYVSQCVSESFPFIFPFSFYVRSCQGMSSLKWQTLLHSPFSNIWLSGFSHYFFSLPASLSINSLFLSFFVFLFQILNWPLFRFLLKSLSSFIFLLFFPFFLYLTTAYVCLFFLFFCFPSFDQPWFILGDMCAFHSLQLACLCKKQKKKKIEKTKRNVAESFKS